MRLNSIVSHKNDKLAHTAAVKVAKQFVNGQMVKDFNASAVRLWG